ncbi:phage tail protein, partial [Aeromonas veronii]
MEKPKQIREVLTRCVPHLKTNPDKLHIFIAPGN